MEIETLSPVRKTTPTPEKRDPKRHTNSTCSHKAHRAADKLGLERDWRKVFGLTVTKCSMCGKPLRDTVSVNRGMGPDCSAQHYDIEHTITNEMVATALGIMQASGLDPRVKHEAVQLRDKPRELCNLLVWWSSANLSDADTVLDCANVVQELGFESMAERLKERNTDAIITRDEDDGFFIVRMKATSNVLRNLRRLARKNGSNVTSVPREGRFKYGFRFPATLKGLVWTILGEDFGNQWATTPGKKSSDPSQVVKVPRKSAYEVRKAWQVAFPRPSLKATPKAQAADPIVRVKGGVIEIHSPKRNFAFVDALKAMVPYRDRDWNRKEVCWKVKGLSYEPRIRALVAKHFNGMV
jgi:hypothetical protein